MTGAGPLDTSVPGVGHEAVALSTQLLSVHCDQRYGDAGMRGLGRVLQEVIGGYARADRPVASSGRGGEDGRTSRPSMQPCAHLRQVQAAHAIGIEVATA